MLALETARFVDRGLESPSDDLAIHYVVSMVAIEQRLILLRSDETNTVTHLLMQQHTNQDIE